MPNLLEQLGQRQVPATPPRLKLEVRQRVNTALIALQLAEFILRAMPFALLHFAKAVAGLILYTLTGTYEPRVKDDARVD
jgi:hypothetical protein